jgi:uncharacterized protein YfiM (DUF2279 family)
MRINNSLLLILAMFRIACDQGSINQVPVERDHAITAAFRFMSVDSLAQSKGKGLRLTTIRSLDVNFDGTSSTWQYEYFGSTPSAYCFHSTYRSVAFDSTSPARDGVAIITHTWFNSDVALSIAERNGGSDFRSRNPGFSIMASLAQPLVPNAGTYWYITYRSVNNQSRVDLAVDAVTGSVAQYYVNRLQD